MELSPNQNPTIEEEENQIQSDEEHKSAQICKIIKCDIPKFADGEI